MFYQRICQSTFLYLSIIVMGKVTKLIVEKISRSPEMSKINLKDKYSDGEIDLSMCDLQDVPVKEIVSLFYITNTL